ncbi:MAG: diacylglycerol/lipid kinase family protein, partial [Dehalococcoidales bacterium]
EFLLSSKFANVIVNPTAGAGKTGKLWPRIMSIFQRHGLRFEHTITEAPGHAIELAKSAAKKGYDMVVSVGGDGTIHEVVNGLYASGNINDNLLGIVNTGTGGDYIRTAGIPRKVEDACKRFLQPKQRTVDLGVVEYAKNGEKAERLFVNFAGMGFDAEIVRRTTQQFKRLGALPSYLMGLITTLLTYQNHKISITVDGKTEERRICTVIMNNGKYGGGGMLTAPQADFTDGLLDVLIIGDVNKPDLLGSLPRIYKGTHLTHPKVATKKAREIEVKSLGERLYLQADGELLGEVPARFRILPAALNLIV